MSTSAFLPVRQHYSAHGRETTDYLSILPKRLSLRRNYTSRRFTHSDRTLFREVSITPFRDVMRRADCDLAAWTHGQRTETTNTLLSAMTDTLRDIIQDNWDPSHPHIILHSSGYDSRLISWTIRSLYEELGSEWLGDVLFVCSKWEGKTFKEIMAYEGWDRSQYLVVREDKKAVNYFANQLSDFEHAWEWSNGVSAIPVNLFWYLVSEPELSGRITAPAQVWNGQWGNTASTASGRGAGQAVLDLWRMFYYSVLFARPMRGAEIVRPFASRDYLKLIATSSVISDEHHLRRAVLRKLDPHLAAFVNENSDGDRHQRIDDKLIAQMAADYEASWYAKATQRPFGLRHRTTEFQGAWSRWTAASFCEYLLKHGYEIEVA